MVQEKNWRGEEERNGCHEEVKGGYFMRQWQEGRESATDTGTMS